MNQKILNRLSVLLSVKSIVTISLTVVFAILAFRGSITAAQVMTIYTMVIGFYFGTQSQKNQDTLESLKGDKK